MKKHCLRISAPLFIDISQLERYALKKHVQEVYPKLLAYIPLHILLGRSVQGRRFLDAPHVFWNVDLVDTHLEHIDMAHIQAVPNPDA